MGTNGRAKNTIIDLSHIKKLEVMQIFLLIEVEWNNTPKNELSFYVRRYAKGGETNFI